jgi:deoxycytidylate deaminase
MLGRAVEIARTSTVKQKHGAVIYKSGRVLAVGVNSVRNAHDTMEIDPDNYTFHAEVAALRAAAMINDFKGATAYVARVNRQNKPVNSCPCGSCLDILMANDIKRIVFTI